MCAQRKNGAFPWVTLLFTEDQVARTFRSYVIPLKRKYKAEMVDPALAAERQEVVKKRSRSFSRRKQVSVWKSPNRMGY